MVDSEKVRRIFDDNVQKGSKIITEESAKSILS